jgi:O-antigen/teichoic acid export membrane protein
MANLSYKVQQRDHRFEKETIIDASRVGADLLVTVLVALRTHSYLAVLAGAYANAGVHLILSHIRPSNPYQFIPRRQLIRLVGRFSMPIYVNAAMLFAAMQGDRMVVASMFSKRQLALYAIACTLGQGSAQLLSKVIEKLLLPILTARSRSLAARRTQARRIGGLIIAGSALFFAGIGMWGPGLIPVIYGPVYGGLRNLVVASAIFQMIQIQQSWLTSLLISNGSTAAIPKITMMRAVAFPAAVIFASFGLSLVAIPLAFALGAALSLGVSYYATRSLGLVDKRLMLTSFLLIAAAILLAVWFSLGGQK